MPEHTFILNGKRVSVDCADDVRLLWVLRDLLGVHGPKYGCGIGVCQACTCHINGKAFNPCAVPVSADQGHGQDHHDRGAGRDRRQAAASRAAGVARPRRRAVRLLPAGPDHDGGREGQAGQGRGPERSPTPISTRSATSAAAAPTRASARRSGRPPRRCEGPNHRRLLASAGRPPVTVNVCLLSDWLEVLPTNTLMRPFSTTNRPRLS